MLKPLIRGSLSVMRWALAGVGVLALLLTALVATPLTRPPELQSISAVRGTVDFSALPARVNQPMTAFPDNLANLPTVSFVIPNLDHDMHNGTLAQADQWLQAHLGPYAHWSSAHNSLLVITTDEDDDSQNNQVATILAGAHVRPGQYDTRTDHYGLLRTLLDSYHLTPFAEATHNPPLETMWSNY